jgi:Zn-dependent protease with chaperone function
MAVILRFLEYNLLPSLAAGLVAWLIVLGVVRLFRIRSSALGFCFFSLPVVKSVLILLGVGLVFPWPGQWFKNWHSLALPFWQVLPILLIWAAGAYLVYMVIVRDARLSVLHEAQPAAEAAPRLMLSFEKVVEGYRSAPCPQCDDDLCRIVQLKGRPQLLVSPSLHTPLALTDGGDPLILFPAGLASQLSDAELAGALAHELAHFYLRRPNWCSAGTLQKLTLIDPVASLVGEYLHRQEEIACDELAISILGQPEVYAGMLTKSYRYALDKADGTAWGRLQVLPHLMGGLVGPKPLLSARVEHLLSIESTSTSWMQSRLVAWLLLAVLILLFFYSNTLFPS